MGIERRCVPENKHWAAVRKTDLDALEMEIDALRADAERYRWLRDKSAYVGVNPHARPCLWVLRGIYEIQGKGFDAAIDAAIKESSND